MRLTIRQSKVGWHMAPHSCLSDEQLLNRIRGEYLEMPGLRLNIKQAQRLWSLDEPTCTQLLESLAQAGFLAKRGQDIYVRMTDGLALGPDHRMAKASLERRRVARAG